MPITLEIVTPDAKVFSEEVDQVIVPTSNGKIGVLPHHVPVIDKLVAGDLRTAKVLNDMGNDVASYLKFTVDCPSTNANGWMPLLATEVRVAEDNTIDYEFYEKPISSRYVMMQSSAMSAKVKMTLFLLSKKE